MDENQNLCCHLEVPLICSTHNVFTKTIYVISSNLFSYTKARHNILCNFLCFS